MVRDYTTQATSLMEFDCAAQCERTLLIYTHQRRFLRLFEYGCRSYRQAVFKSGSEPSSGLAGLITICALPLHRERLVNLGK